MADIADIRAGLAANLSTVPNCQISAYQRSQPAVPSIQVVGPEIDYNFAPHAEEMTWTIRGLVAAVNDEGGQRRLDKWKAGSGSESIRQAVEADKQLGGACDNLHVTGVGRDQIFVYGTVEALGAEWSVTVIT
jgi:hypothetical protein